MDLLALFAVLAGAGTALSPCVLPILPALLSAGATGGRRRPLGIVVGLAVTFTITIVGLAEVVDGVGFGDGTLRGIAIAVLLGFGVALAVPAVGARLEAPLSRLGRHGPRTAGDGLVSGLGAGAALGFVYAPCAGPILAAVIAVSAASGRTLLIGAAYALGTAIALLALALGGRRLLDGVRRGARGALVQRALGGVMALTALAMALGADTRFQAAIATHLPNAVVDPARPIEDSAAVRSRLAELRGRPSGLPRYGVAPDFTGTQRWFNTPGGRALSLRELRGRVVLVDFWTYTCINCLRTLPYLTAWDRRYRDAGLTIVGVHSPEFSFERDAGNVQDAIARAGIRYPVAQDSDLATWNAWGNRYWPAKFLIDATGLVRRAHVGEGEYLETERAIRALLAERGDRALGANARVRGAVTPAPRTTPETYLGARRAEGFAGDPPRAGTRAYRAPRSLGPSTFALAGTWRVSDESATAVRDARLVAVVQAKDVYLVLSGGAGRAGRVHVAIDGRPAGASGADVRGGAITVRRQRLYHVAHFDAPGRHRLDLRFAPGVSGFAFTFG
ncbi:MAG TPA: redoxin family protein [Solirubrobacteraceae bacterium]|nr:redoxin family protein [Solirubrobacteraceae bacterium]